MKKIDKEKFGQRLKNLIEEQGITQKDLALKVEVTEKALCDWIKGRKEPRYYYLEELSDYFKVDIRYLAGMTNSRNSVRLWENDIKSALSHHLLKNQTFERYLNLLDYGVELNQFGKYEITDNSSEIEIEGGIEFRKVEVNKKAFEEFQRSVDDYIRFQAEKLIEKAEKQSRKD